MNSAIRSEAQGMIVRESVTCGTFATPRISDHSIGTIETVCTVLAICKERLIRPVNDMAQNDV